jgi:hypothetical protein
VAVNLTTPDDPLYSDSASINSAGCSSAHLTIAPVPSSVLASVSAWNASYSSALATITNSGGSSPNTASTGQIGSTSKGGSSTKSANGSSSSIYTSTFTFGGGALPTSTTSGSSEATTTTPTSTKAGSNTGGAEGWKDMSRVAVILSIVSFGVSVLYVL